MFVLFVGATAMRPVPPVLLRPAAATDPRLRAAILLQQEPGKDGRVIRLPPREAWGVLLACQVTIIAAVFGWMVAFAPEQLRVDAERRRTDCVQLPLQPLRGAWVPIQPLTYPGPNPNPHPNQVRACRSWRMDYCRPSRCASGAVMLRAAVTPGRRGWSVARRALTPKHRACCASGAASRRTSGGAPPSRRPPSPSPSRAAAARPRPLLRQPLSPISTGPPRQPGQLRQPLRWPRCQPLGRRRSSSADPAPLAPTPTVRVHLLTLTLALTLTPTLALTLTLALALALTLTLTLTLALALTLTRGRTRSSSSRSSTRAILSSASATVASATPAPRAAAMAVRMRSGSALEKRWGGRELVAASSGG